MFIEREYQTKCEDAIFKAWETYQSTLVEMATGCGKTIIFAKVIKTLSPKRALVLAHRNELIVQAKEKIEAVTGLSCQIEKADQYASTSIFDRSPVVVSSIQSQISGDAMHRRYMRFKPEDFGVVIADECHHCFPFGAKVLTSDGEMSIGDLVSQKKKVLVASVNLCNDVVEWKQITGWFRSPNKQLLKITHERGSITCSGNHEIWTEGGYERAENLVPGMRLRVVQKTVSSNSKFLEAKAGLQQFVPWKTNGIEISNSIHPVGQKQETACQKNLCAMPKGLLYRVKRHSQRKPEILLPVLCGEMDNRNSRMEGCCKNTHTKNAQVGGREEATRNQRTNETEKPNETRERQVEDGKIPIWKNIFSSWRKWGIDQTTNIACGNIGLAHRAPNSNDFSEASVSITSDLLQSGYSEPRKKDRCGSGWENPQIEEVEVFRSSENISLECSRVVSVEILERRSGRESEESGFQDSCLYDIEVEGNHNYFSDGVLVSNSTSASWKEVIGYYLRNKETKLLGVTATADRSDGAALGQIFQSCAFKYGILDAINDGWLVDITQQFVQVKSLDFSHVRTTCGDLNEGDLAKVMEAEENIQGVCQPTLEAIYGLPPKTLSTVPVPQWREYLKSLNKVPRRTIVFTVSVLQAEMCANVFLRAMEGVEWVCGETNKQKRSDILKRFLIGETAVVVNCGVLTEGYDNPKVELISVARPTKSRSLYCQIIGRSTRTLPGIVDGIPTAELRRKAIAESAKPFCRILDHVGNSGRHKMISCVDVLGGHVSEAAAEAAKKKAMDGGKPVRIMVTMTNAEIELERKKAEAAERARLEKEARRSHLMAKADYSSQDVDAFGNPSGERLPFKNRMSKDGRAFSEKQCNVLRHAGCDPSKLGYRQGQAIIGKQIEKWKAAKESRQPA